MIYKLMPYKKSVLPIGNCSSVWEENEAVRQLIALNTEKDCTYANFDTLMKALDLCFGIAVGKFNVVLGNKK